MGSTDNVEKKLVVDRFEIDHDIKSHYGPFRAIWEDRKFAEHRNDDRNYQVGQMVRMREFGEDNRSYTGRWVIARITHVAKGSYGIADGHCLWSFRKVADSAGRRFWESREVGVGIAEERAVAIPVRGEILEAIRATEPDTFPGRAHAITCLARQRIIAPSQYPAALAFLGLHLDPPEAEPTKPVVEEASRPDPRQTEHPRGEKSPVSPRGDKPEQRGDTPEESKGKVILVWYSEGLNPPRCSFDPLHERCVADRVIVPDGWELRGPADDRGMVYVGPTNLVLSGINLGAGGVLEWARSGRNGFRIKERDAGAKDRDIAWTAALGRLRGLQSICREGERFEHYKGNIYAIDRLSIKEDTLDILITYIPSGKSYAVTRTFEDFFSFVETPTGHVQRFARVTKEAL